MRQFAQYVGLVGASSALVLALGCATEGPAEKAGRQIDTAVTEINEAIEAINEGAELAGDTSETMLDETGELAEDSAETLSDVARRTIEKTKLFAILVAAAGLASSKLSE